MLVILRSAGLGLLLSAAACQPQSTSPVTAVTAPSAALVPATAAVAPPPPQLLSAPLDTTLRHQIAHPQLGDVYVVAYQPGGGTTERYFFYRVNKVAAATVELLPARREASDPAADVGAAGFFTDKALTYTRTEALELTQEQPGDVQHTRLVAVRREK